MTQSTPLYPRVKAAASSLRAWVEARSYAGYDPYDALNSPILRMASLGLKWPRILITQTVKRLPFNIRPLMLVRKGLNPKGLGLFLWSYTKMHRALGDETSKEQAYHVLDLLEKCRADCAHGHGWGYNFNWQSRAFYVPKGTPTIVNSCFVGHALLDAYEHFGDQRFLDMAMPIKDFILNDLHRTHEGDGFCFSYTPIDQLIVHNANLLGASLLIRLHKHGADEDCRQAALSSLAYSMARQRPDGSWWYADTDYQQWIDSFHTGFNLQCIRWFLNQGEALHHKEGYERGVAYYAAEFFKPDGTAKYFHDRTLPEDIHSYAQALVFFAEEGEQYEKLLDSVGTRMLDKFQDSSGYFYFQMRKGRPIRIAYMRWAQSWALHALTSYLLYQPDDKTGR